MLVKKAAVYPISKVSLMEGYMVTIPFNTEYCLTMKIYDLKRSKQVCVCVCAYDLLFFFIFPFKYELAGKALSKYARQKGSLHILGAQLSFSLGIVTCRETAPTGLLLTRLSSQRKPHGRSLEKC